MAITFTEVSSPKWVDAEHSAIDMMVKFDHIAEIVPFTASQNDTEKHGRDLFQSASNGEFGEVAAFIPLTPLQVAERDNPPKRSNELSLAIGKVNHHDMMGDATKSNSWRIYYQQLFALQQNPDWPIVDVWPTAPLD